MAMESQVPKEVQIEAIRHEVGQIEDKLGMPIDEGIKDTVVYLKALDFPTSQSCEGHLQDDEGDEQPRAPFVEIYPKEPSEENWVDIPELRDKVTAESAALKEKATKLLDEFYGENPDIDAKAKLTLWQIAYGFRFEPEGAEQLASLTGAEAKSTLSAQQAEMNKFTEFLKEKAGGEGLTTKSKPLNKGPYQPYAAKGGGFDVMLPAGIDLSNERVMGFRTDHFETIEEARAAAEGTKREMSERQEYLSLEKSFGSYYKISKTEKGYEVTGPALRQKETGFLVGTYARSFETWGEAKAAYLETRSDDETLMRKPLMRVDVDKDDIVSFSDHDGFNPIVTPSENMVELPEASRKNFEAKDSSGENKTFQETIKEEGWQNEIYRFVQDYLSSEGSKLQESLGIERLDALTPRQAIDLSTAIVIELTKYKQSETVEAESKDGLSPSEKRDKLKEGTESDHSSALTLLRQGQRNKNNPDWEGNGVCRNFAAMVKSVFESVKANQTKFSRLGGTYCYISSEGYGSKRTTRRTTSIGGIEIGHAWNTFVSATERGGTNATIVDATWGKMDLDSKKVQNLDYTLARMEPFVYSAAEEIAKRGEEDKLGDTLDFYSLKMDRTGGGNGAEEETERVYLATQVVDLLRKTQKVPENISEGLAADVISVYTEMSPEEVDPSELSILFTLSKKTGGAEIANIIDAYLKEGSVDAYHANHFTFSNNPDLQVLVYEKIKSAPKFDELLEKGEFFRKSLKEALPALFPFET